MSQDVPSVTAGDVDELDDPFLLDVREQDDTTPGTRRVSSCTRWATSQGVVGAADRPHRARHLPEAVPAPRPRRSSSAVRVSTR